MTYVSRQFISRSLKTKDMVKVDNTAVLKNSKKLMKQIVSGHLYDMLAKTCDDLLEDAVTSKEYQGFTGNTQTSYSCGLYVDGVFSYYVNQKMWSEKPVRKKIPKGVFVYLKKPYEGRARSVLGRVDVDSLYGKDSAFRFLRSYKDVPRSGFAIVMATGTEYSAYIEFEHGLNVLSDTFMKAKSIFKKNMKPIP